MLSTLEKYHNDQRRLLETDYREWLLETNQFKELPKDAAANNNNNNYSATNQNMSRQNSIKSLGRQNSSSSSCSGSQTNPKQKTPEPTRQKYKSAKRGLKNLEID